MFNILKPAFLRQAQNAVRRNTTLNNHALFALNKAHFSQGTQAEATSQTAEAVAEDIIFEQQRVKEQAAPKESFLDYLSKKSPNLGKVANFVVDSWDQTFPSDKYQAKSELVKKQAREQAEKEKMQKVYTEEELEQIQAEIPDWKRTSLAAYEENTTENVSIRSRVGSLLKEKFNQTRVAKKLYKTEPYKEYEVFKQVMGEFKEDLNDHLSQSQNPAVIASMTLIGKATSESSSALAIKEMRKYQKDFDVFELERDVRGIFVDAYNAYLAGDQNYLDKTCEDAGLAFFKTMLRKREADGVIPKYVEIWESEPADFIAGKISERNQPCFSFTLRIQEIYCNISKKTGKIVDGAEDRVVQNRYNIVLSLAENPDFENVGHKWAITEVIPVEAVLMLA